MTSSTEEETRIVINWRLECKLVQPLWRGIGSNLRKLEIYKPYDPGADSYMYIQEKISHMFTSRYDQGYSLHPSVQFSCSVVSDSATPWIAARQASLSITNSQSLLKLMPIESVMPSSHLILCHPLLLLPPIPPRIRVFSNESTLHMRWPKYWSFSFSMSPSNEHPGLISLQSKGLWRVFSNTTVQKRQFFVAQVISKNCKQAKCLSIM